MVVFMMHDFRSRRRRCRRSSRSWRRGRLQLLLHKIEGRRLRLIVLLVQLLLMRKRRHGKMLLCILLLLMLLRRLKINRFKWRRRGLERIFRRSFQFPHSGSISRLFPFQLSQNSFLLILQGVSSCRFQYRSGFLNSFLLCLFESSIFFGLDGTVRSEFRFFFFLFRLAGPFLGGHNACQKRIVLRRLRRRSGGICCRRRRRRSRRSRRNRCSSGTALIPKKIQTSFQILNSFFGGGIRLGHGGSSGFGARLSCGGSVVLRFGLFHHHGCRLSLNFERPISCLFG
mmetsp:Transcript_22434/g.46906  ORF Transcript_22434/g.46906 Transcript_22434/m.46906 type:complete len:285 (-) Transcript_22434:75-929(-)